MNDKVAIELLNTATLAASMKCTAPIPISAFFSEDLLHFTRGRRLATRNTWRGHLFSRVFRAMAAGENVLKEQLEANFDYTFLAAVENSAARVFGNSGR